MSASQSVPERRALVVFCERLDNESFCESLVRELAAHYEVRPCGPGWPDAGLHAVDVDTAAAYLELDSASGSFVRPLGLERLDLPKVAWLIDTHKKPEFHRQISGEMNLSCYAMPGWAHVLTGRRAWLPVHFDPRYFRPREAEREHDLVFVGSQPWRADPLRRIAGRHGLSLHVSTTTGRREKSETAALYARARLVFNRHVTNDLNLRLVEAPACGRVLLSDAQWNGQYELFQDGEHLVLYKDERDLEAQVLALLGDDARRARIERAAAAHAHAHHTTAARAAQLRELIDGLIEQRARRLAPLAAVSKATPGEAADFAPALEPDPLPGAVRAILGRESARWLVAALGEGSGERAAGGPSYGQRLGAALEAAGQEVVLARVGETLASGPLPQVEDPTRRALVQAPALQRALEGLLRADGPFAALLVEGALGALVGPALARRHGLRLVLALEASLVGRCRNQLTRPQLHAAELEQWGAEQAAAVWVPDEGAAADLRRFYGVAAAVVGAGRSAPADELAPSV